VLHAGQLRPGRAVGRRAHAALDTRAGELALTGATIAILSVVAATSIAGMGSRPSKPLVLVAVLAGSSILLTIAPGQLLLAWLFLAPLLQESASASHLGHILSLALYTAPPLALLVRWLASREASPRREWFDLLPVAYILFLLASLAITATNELRPSTLHALYQNVMLGPLVYYLVAFWRGRLPPLPRIAQVVLLAAALQAAMAMVEWATGWNLWHDTSWQGTDTRAIATLSNPAVTGAFIGVGIVLALAVLCWDGPATLQRLSVVMLVVGFPGLYATKTRGPMLATLVAVALCLLLSGRSRLVGLGVVAVVALALVVFWPAIRSSSTFRNRFDNRQNVEARVVLQNVSVRLAEKKPILGWGYDSFDRVKFDVPVASHGIPLAQALQSTSHDTYLTMLVEFGLVGLALFLLPWLPIAVRGIRWARARAPDRWIVVGALGSILVLGIDGATLDFRFFSFAPMLAWLFLGIVRRETSGLAPRPA
jgi:O-antigen ligase